VAEISEELMIADVERRLTSKYGHLPLSRSQLPLRGRARDSSRARFGTLFRCQSSGTPALS
jgi:hypothetical protein